MLSFPPNMSTDDCVLGTGLDTDSTLRRFVLCSFYSIFFKPEGLAAVHNLVNLKATFFNDTAFLSKPKPLGKRILSHTHLYCSLSLSVKKYKHLGIKSTTKITMKIMAALGTGCYIAEQCNQAN